MRIQISSVPIVLLLIAILLAGYAPFATEVVFADPTTDPKNHPPVAIGTVQENPEGLWTNMTIRFTSAGSYDIDGEGRISFIWDFGDGSNQSTLASPNHVYEDPGIYTVTLWVSDHKGLIDIATWVLVIQRNYGDSDIVIRAIMPTDHRTYRDPDPNDPIQVAVMRDGWVAYRCDIQADREIEVVINITGDRPADVYLFKHEDFLTYQRNQQENRVPFMVKGSRVGLTDEFRYTFMAEDTDRYYIVVDNKDRPIGTETEGPVDYTISIANLPFDGREPNDPWDIVRNMMWPLIAIMVVTVAIVVEYHLIRWRSKK